MEAVNTDDQPKNSVKQMRKISEFFVRVLFFGEKCVSDVYHVGKSSKRIV